eukprot:749418-Hanusia_phi.AAC.6
MQEANDEEASRIRRRSEHLPAGGLNLHLLGVDQVRLVSGLGRVSVYSQGRLGSDHCVEHSGYVAVCFHTYMLASFLPDGGYQGKEESQEEWTCHYAKSHDPSFQRLQEMKLQEPICLRPGTRVGEVAKRRNAVCDVASGVYVHSACYGDDQIVYDNQRHHVSHSVNWRPPGLKARFSPGGFLAGQLPAHSAGQSSPVSRAVQSNARGKRLCEVKGC